MADEYSSKSKFNSPRDELLSIMCAHGWAIESSGDIQASTGWFGRITNEPEERGDLAAAFQEDVERLGSAALDGTIGHFLLVETNDGFVTVTEYENEQHLIADYQIRGEVYSYEHEYQTRHQV